MNPGALPSPRIEIRRDGPFYRLSIDPAGSLPESALRPTTHCSHMSAAREAEIMRRATGWPVIDHTLCGAGAAS